MFQFILLILIKGVIFVDVENVYCILQAVTDLSVELLLVLLESFGKYKYFDIMYYENVSQYDHHVLPYSPKHHFILLVHYTAITGQYIIQRCLH